LIKTLVILMKIIIYMKDLCISIKRKKNVHPEWYLYLQNCLEKICAFCKKKLEKYHYHVVCPGERVKVWREESLLKINEVIEVEEEGTIKDKNLTEN